MTVKEELSWYFWIKFYLCPQDEGQNFIYSLSVYSSRHCSDYNRDIDDDVAFMFVIVWVLNVPS